MSYLRSIKNNLSIPIVWPPLQEELRGYLQYFTGNVLNAGAGDRDISSFISGKLFNQDLPGGLHNKNIHFYASLDNIPMKDESFDSIICNAVLEHVENPNKVIKEFSRILKRGGYLYLCVPFLQPEHLDPGDFQRYTKYGLKKLVEENGFSVVKLEGVHSVYHTLARIVQDWLTSKNCFKYRLLRLFIFPLLNYKTRYSKAYVDTIASAYRVLAIKN